MINTHNVYIMDDKFSATFHTFALEDQKGFDCLKFLYTQWPHINILFWEKNEDI